MIIILIYRYGNTFLSRMWIQARMASSKQGLLAQDHDFVFSDIKALEPKAEYGFAVWPKKKKLLTHLEFAR